MERGRFLLAGARDRIFKFDPRIIAVGFTWGVSTEYLERRREFVPVDNRDLHIAQGLVENIRMRVTREIQIAQQVDKVELLKAGGVKAAKKVFGI